MHKVNSIVMQEPRRRIFETAADLSLWPKILPHYRYIEYLEKSPTRNIVKMAATRSGIPISWVSEQIIDPEAMEVRFTHLHAWNKGMKVVWTFTQTPGGVLVEIVHDLQFRFPPLAPMADTIIGDFFTFHVANQTLRCMKAWLESSRQGTEGPQRQGTKTTERTERPEGGLSKLPSFGPCRPLRPCLQF